MTNLGAWVKTPSSHTTYSAITWRTGYTRIFGKIYHIVHVRMRFKKYTISEGKCKKNSLQTKWKYSLQKSRTIQLQNQRLTKFPMSLQNQRLTKFPMSLQNQRLTKFPMSPMFLVNIHMSENRYDTFLKAQGKIPRLGVFLSPRPYP